MIQIKTKLGKSRVHGIGLFTHEFVPKGKITWKYDPKFDTSFTEEELKEMSEPARQQFLHYAYFDEEIKKYVLCFDDQRFINHTNDLNKANIISTPQMDTALRDIQPGEELLCNYNGFDKTYFNRHNIKETDLID